MRGKADLDSARGKADDVEEETGTCTPRTAVTGAQATREGFTEITSGRSRGQQRLGATCIDSSNEAHAEGEESPSGLAHESVGAMTGE
jgi:hypothetical protein